MEVSAYTVATETPEADGTLSWKETTLVRLAASTQRGFGYSFANVAAAHLIDDHLKREVLGGNMFDIPAQWMCMLHAIRNLGRPGVCSMAIAAVNNAMWDLKGRRIILQRGIRLWIDARPPVVRSRDNDAAPSDY